MKNKRRPTKHIPPLSEKGIIFLKILDGFGVLLMMITMLACIEIEQMDQIFFGGTFCNLLYSWVDFRHPNCILYRKRIPLLTHPRATKNFFLRGVFFLSDRYSFFGKFL
jgi:hypothetical protein